MESVGFSQDPKPRLRGVPMLALTEIRKKIDSEFPSSIFSYRSSLFVGNNEIGEPVYALILSHPNPVDRNDRNRIREQMASEVTVIFRYQNRAISEARERRNNVLNPLFDLFLN